MEPINQDKIKNLAGNPIEESTGDLEVNNKVKPEVNSKSESKKVTEKISVDFKGGGKNGISLEKIKFVFVPLVLFLVGIGVMVFITYPKAQEYYSNIAVVKAKEAEINALSDKLKVLQQFSSVENVLDENSAVLTRAVPTEQTVPQFMTLVQSISKNSGVELKSLTYSGTAPTSEKSALATNGLSKIELVYIQGSATGDYNSIKTFVRSLEASLRVMNIDNVRLSSDGSAEAARVSLSFAITAYSAIIQAQAIPEQPINFNLTDGNFSKVLDFLNGQNDYNVDVADIGIGKQDPFSN